MALVSVNKDAAAGCGIRARGECRGGVWRTLGELEERKIVQGLCAGYVCSETGEVGLSIMQAGSRKWECELHPGLGYAWTSAFFHCRW